MYFSVLSKNQIGLLKKLRFLKKYGFYLAGGTALALQICHRTSLDFDFYTKKKFDNKKLFKELEKRFKKTILLEKAEDTLIVKINNVAASFFSISPSLNLPDDQTRGVTVADLKEGYYSHEDDFYL